MGRIKKIYDSVHRFIHVDEVESLLINTLPFQRLHYIYQLGVAYFVYPGGTHRRFAHSLGVMELATRIYDQITSGPLPRKLMNKIPCFGTIEYHYWRRVLRLAALCHDLGHLPFSHVAERRLLGKEGHEIWTRKIVNGSFLESVWKKFEAECLQDGVKCDVRRDVMKVALGKKKLQEDFTPWERIVTEIVTGDFFGADRMDYLLRDAQCTGLAYGLFDYHQLIAMLKIIICPDENLVLGIEENGIESCEALLLARHYMHKRLYQYPSVKSYDYHLARFMETVYYDLGDDLNRYIMMTDNEVLTELSRASRNKRHPGYVDAKCFYDRDCRFRAIPLSCSSLEKDLLVVKKELKISDNEIEWEISKKEKDKSGMHFPVLKQDGTIDIGDNLSEISVPSKDRNWIYVAPRYESQLRKKLNRLGVLG